MRDRRINKLISRTTIKIGVTAFLGICGNLRLESLRRSQFPEDEPKYWFKNKALPQNLWKRNEEGEEERREESLE